MNESSTENNPGAKAGAGEVELQVGAYWNFFLR